MNNNNPEIRKNPSNPTRRQVLAGLFGTGGALLLPDSTLKVVGSVAEAEAVARSQPLLDLTAKKLSLSANTASAAPLEACAPAVIIKNSSQMLAAVNMVGQRVIEEVRGDQITSYVEGPSDKVDLSLYVAQDERTRKRATFKADRDIIVDGWATLIYMEPKKEDPTKSTLIGPNFQWEGNWGFDTKGLVERCGVEVLEDAWLINVDRARVVNGKVEFTPEFSFPVVPDCGPKAQRYISTVRRVFAQPQPAREATPVPTATPVVPMESPTQMPIKETGTPGATPAQMPLRGEG